MGVDIQTYRAKIGTFRHSTGVDVVTVVHVVNFSQSLKYVGCVLFIGMLLIMAGVEQNPGPRKSDTLFFTLAIAVAVVAVILLNLYPQLKDLYLFMLLTGGIIVVWQLYGRTRSKKNDATQCKKTERKVTTEGEVAGKKENEANTALINDYQNVYEEGSNEDSDSKAEDDTCTQGERNETACSDIPEKGDTADGSCMELDTTKTILLYERQRSDTTQPLVPVGSIGQAKKQKQPIVDVFLQKNETRLLNARIEQETFLEALEPENLFTPS